MRLCRLLFIVAAEARARGLRAGRGAKPGIVLYAFIPGLILAYLVMGLVWPWGVVAPLNPLRAVDYFSALLREAVARTVRRRTDPRPRHAAQLRADAVRPEAAGTVARAWPRRHRRRRRRVVRAAAPPAAARRCCAVTLAATLPIAGDRRAAAGHVQRHPPFRVRAAAARRRSAAGPARGSAGADRALRHASPLAAAAGGAARGPRARRSIDMVRLHPFEYTYFNRIAGGVRGARRALHARLLGPGAQRRPRANCAPTLAARHETPPRRHVEARGLRSASAGQGHARPAISTRPGTRRAPTSP